MLESRVLTARRETLSIYAELRALAWVGVMLIATGVGIVTTKHFDEIGPLTIAFAIGAAAVACYGWAAIRIRGAAAPSVLSESIVLLGALLISTDIAFIEHQWRVLGGEWQRHLLFLAVAHAAAAYGFGSRAVLSLSVTAFASWLGIEHAPSTAPDMALRSFLCAGIIAAWRLANRRRDFNAVFEHFAANLAFWGTLILASNQETRWTGVAVAVGFAIASVLYGFRSRRELFVIYGYVYGLIAIDIAVVALLRDATAIAFYLLVSSVAVIVAMVITHLRFRK